MSLTLFIAVKWSYDLFHMIDSVFPFVDILKAILTEYLLILNTIPIRLINMTLLTFLQLSIPFPDPRRRLASIQIPVVNIILPDILLS